MTMAVPTARSQATVPAGRVGLIDRFSVVLVAVAATLWASDTYFRAQLIGHLKPAQIVVIEDALVSLFLLAFLLRGIPELRRLYMVVFAQDLTAPFSDLQHGRLEAGLYALGAAALWASGTVLGRFVLGKISFTTTTALRFTLALPVLLVIVVLQYGGSAFAHYQASDILPFLGIALIPGFLALLLYYRALRSTPATLATIAELAYPVTATFIASAPPPYGFHQPLYLPQFIGTGLLIAVILILNYTKERTPPVVVQEAAAA
jgi:drug/metabolite transporter (DMT)-like permease